MIIAAFCFLFYELWKLLHPQKMQDVVTALYAISGRSSDVLVQNNAILDRDGCGIIIVDLIYFIWTIIALIWFPEWRFVAGLIIAVSLTKMFLPKSKSMTIADSALGVIILATAIIYFLGVSHG